MSIKKYYSDNGVKKPQNIQFNKIVKSVQKAKYREMDK